MSKIDLKLHIFAFFYCFCWFWASKLLRGYLISSLMRLHFNISSSIDLDIIILSSGARIQAFLFWAISIVKHMLSLASTPKMQQQIALALHTIALEYWGSICSLSPDDDSNKFKGMLNIMSLMIYSWLLDWRSCLESWWHFKDLSRRLFWRI
jgi:hypothetical protein